MTERKIIRVEKSREQHGGVGVITYADKIFDVGDPAPAGHEGRPYTREIADEAPAAARQEQPAQDRMDRGRGARNRKAKG